MAFGVEAASLYVTVGDNGVDATLARVNSVGTAVDALAAKTGAVTVSANTGGAESNLNDLQSRIDSFVAQHPETSLMFNSNPAVRAIGDLQSRWREFKAQVETAITPRINSAFRGVAGLGANALLAGGLNARSIGATALQGVASGAPLLGEGGALASIGGPVTLGIAAAVAGVGASLGKAGEMEKYETQLSVLLGSMDKAHQRLEELTKFAQVTPFELPEVVQASKQLQIFTDGALATGKGLTLVGDVAAGTGQSFGESAMWFGRMYDALQSGRPFGEATRRLQEMGAMSGASRERIEALAEKVKSGAMTMAQAWPMVAKEFDRFGGMMEKQSGTLEGKISNLADAVGQDFAKLGKFLLPVAKIVVDVLIGAFTLLGKGLDAFGKVVDWLAKSPIGFLLGKLGELAGFVVGKLGDAIGWIGDRIGDVGRFFGDAADHIGHAIDDISGKTARMAADAKQAAEFTGSAWAIGFRAEERGISDATDSVAGKIIGSFQKAKTQTIGEVIDTMTGVADAITAGRSKISQAVNQAINNLYDPVVLAAKTSADKTAVVQAEAAAKRTKGNRQQELDEAAHLAELKKTLYQDYAEGLQFLDQQAKDAYIKSALTGEAIVSGLASKSDQIVAQTKAEVAILVDGLSGAALAGYKTGNAYIDGLIAGINGPYQKVVDSLKKYGVLVHAESPPTSIDNPLHDIDEHGFRTGAAWAKSFGAGIGTADASGALKGIGMDLASPNPGPAAYGPVNKSTVLFSPQFNSTVPYTAAEQQELANRLGPALYEYLVSRGAVSAEA